MKGEEVIKNIVRVDMPDKEQLREFCIGSPIKKVKTKCLDKTLVAYCSLHDCCYNVITNASQLK